MNSYFSPEALAQLQEAYALQLNNPEDQDFDQVSGLPTGVVSNTAPWHGQLDLWKYPDGKNPLETAPIMFHANDEYEEDEYEEDEEYEISEDDSQEDDTLSDDEIDTLIEELLNSDEDED